MNKKMLVVIGLSLAMGSFVRAADPLDAARQLYLSAAYEEALDSLANPPGGADLDQVDKLRALCLLALSRRDEAIKSLESLTARRPMLQLDDSESPKLVLLFREARVRMLPPATKSLYAAAKINYEKGELELARQQFTDVLSLLAEPELSRQPETADLKMLAEGFARLVDQQMGKSAGPSPAASQPARTSAAPEPAQSAISNPPLAAAPPSSGPPVASAAPATAAPKAGPPPNTVAPPAGTPVALALPAASEPLIFTEKDPGVTAPIPIGQRLPPWVPPPGLRGQSLSGSIEVVIDETGKVTSASMSKSVNRAYDSLLLGAAKGWQYRPALRDGRPVKFRRVVSIVLAPTS